MNLRATFENRSGRVIAALRIALAFVFLASLAFEPVEPGQSIDDGLILLGTYLLLAVGVMGLTWRSWWLDHHMALPLLLADAALFLGAVFITEGYDADFTSPFLTLFALVVLSTMLRWGWIAAARTGAIISLLFMALGMVLLATDYPLETYRFCRRAFYMVALLLVLVWFGIDRRNPQLPPINLSNDGEETSDLCRAALAYAMQATGATCGVFAWADDKEPWTTLCEARPGEPLRVSRLGPDEPGCAELPGPCLFDRPHRRILVLDSSGKVSTGATLPDLPLAERAGMAEGLALPLASGSESGLILLGGIDAPGGDFLILGRAIAREIERAADRTTANRLERETAVMRARSAIARDLHDSVAQSLAGACFRLEALRRQVTAEGPATAADEIATVRDALRGEQAQVRGLIEALRDPTGLLAPRPLADDLQRTLAEAAAHWNIAASFATDGPVETAGGLSHELRQLMREAVANAARHGRANTVAARLSRRTDGLELTVTDNGGGFADPATKAPPWSISERISALGGQLDVHTGASGTRLAIFLPLAPAQDLTA